MPTSSPHKQVTISPAKIPADYASLCDKIRLEITRGQARIQLTRVRVYWNIGRSIHKHLLKHNRRAGYGEHLFVRLSRDLKISERNLQEMVRFHEAFPIPKAPSELGWTHYRELLRMPDEGMRASLLKQSVKQRFTTRELREEINARKHKKGATTAKLVPGKGALHTYLLATPDSVTADHGYRTVDCGFGIYRQVPAPDLDTAKEGTVVASRWNETWFQLEKSARKKSDLYYYPAGLDYAVDGDTVVLNIDLGLRTWTRQRLRLRGIDAPEAATPQGQKAAAFVKEALSKAKAIFVKTYAKDKYGRYLADIFLGSERLFLNQKLLDEGLAVLYNV